MSLELSYYRAVLLTVSTPLSTKSHWLESCEIPYSLILINWPRCRCCARRSCRGWGCLIPWRASPAAGAAALLPSCCCSWVDATAVWSCCWRLGGSCCTPWGWGSPAATPAAAAAAAAVLLVPSVVDDSALVPETHREKMFISQFWKRSQTAWIVFKILLPIYLEVLSTWLASFSIRSLACVATSVQHKLAKILQCFYWIRLPFTAWIQPIEEWPISPNCPSLGGNRTVPAVRGAQWVSRSETISTPIPNEAFPGGNIYTPNWIHLSFSVL